jgi:hypothetical protein
MNLGKSQTGPLEQIDMYRRLDTTLRPEVVVHVLYPNDLDGVYTRDTLLGIYAIRDSQLWLSGQSYLFRYMEHRIRQRMAMRETINYFRGGGDAAQKDAAWAELALAVRETKALVEAGGATYCIAFHPWLFHLDDPPLVAEHARMASLTQALDVPYLDLLPVFEGLDASELRISSINEHANPLGHEIAARGLARFLLEEVLPLYEGRRPGE